MESQIVTQANEFLRIISPELDETQVEYLSWRVCGFSRSESIAFSKVDNETVKVWAGDEKFQLLEQEALGELQGQFAQDIMSLNQKRNARVVSAIDTTVIQKAFIAGIGSLSRDEFAYLSQIRNQYNPDVRRMLGMGENQGNLNIPTSFDEAVILLRRRGHGNDQGEAEAVPQNIIETEYTKSPELPPGPEDRPAESDTD